MVENIMVNIAVKAVADMEKTINVMVKTATGTATAAIPSRRINFNVNSMLIITIPILV